MKEFLYISKYYLHFLLFKFIYNTNSYQVNTKKQLELLDFIAFLLGLLAGFSFLSKITKYLCDRCNCLNITENDFAELEEELERKPKQELEMNNSENKNGKEINL